MRVSTPHRLCFRNHPTTVYPLVWTETSVSKSLRWIQSFSVRTCFKIFTSGLILGLVYSFLSPIAHTSRIVQRHLNLITCADGEFLSNYYSASTEWITFAGSQKSYFSGYLLMLSGFLESHARVEREVVLERGFEGSVCKISHHFQWIKSNDPGDLYL